VIKYIAITSLLLFAGFAGKAQNLVTGKVVDAKTGQEVAYATVSVLDVTNGGVPDGVSTDSLGDFRIKGLPNGRYQFSVSFLGYVDQRSDTLILDGPQLKLPVIQLRPVAQALSDVVISARAPVVENKIDKIVYNTANDITTQGGVVLDVLKKVPEVSVDADGNVELQGNSNIRFLINGKPSGIFGNSLSDALASIPASQIKSIEAITNPGAKYDAQGTAGIINIILKDNKIKGINGSISASAGTRIENTAVNLNARNGNIGVNAFFSGNTTLKAKAFSSQDRASVNTADQTTTRLLQAGYGNLSRRGYQAGLGFDWDLSKRDVLTGTVQYNDFSNTRGGITDLAEVVTGLSGTTVDSSKGQRNATSRMNTYAVDWSLDYKHRFSHEGEELDISYNASLGRPVSQYSQEQFYDGATLPYSGTASYNPGRDNQHNISLDYVLPLGKKAKIEAGAKSSLHSIASLTDVNILSPKEGVYINDPLQSYDLNYKMNIYAGYVSGTFSLLHFLDVKAGFRVEHTDVGIDYRDTKISSYNTYAPSVILSHKLAERQYFKLAYAHRIERPEYEELNPFLNLSDPYNITTGNPLLKPENGDNFELGYNRSFENGGSLYVSLVERINSQDIKPFTQFYPVYTVGDSAYRNVSVTNRRNIGTEYNSGLVVSASLPLLPHLNARGNLMLFNRHILNDLEGANAVTNGYNWRLNLNVNYQLPYNIVAEAFGNYKSPFNSIQGKSPQFLTYTIAVRKQFRDKKASIGITATNPFANSVRQFTTISNDAYTSYNIREIPLRSFGITFSYRFGGLDFDKTRKNDHNIPDLPVEN